MSKPAAIPGLTGIEHVGLGVPDIGAATRFLVDVLGGEAIYDVGPFDAPQEWMAHHLAVGPGARIHRMRVVKIAGGPVVELVEFVDADGHPLPASGAQQLGPGGFHVAFYVEDMDAALAALKAHGAAILSGPVDMTEGPSAGLTWLYFRAPWGQQLELVSYPGGIAAYRERRLQVWRPEP